MYIFWHFLLSRSEIFRLSVKKGVVAKKRKPTKDPNKPKKALTFLFSLNYREDFRVTYKQKHPNNKSVAAKKVPYIHTAEKRMSDYEKSMTSYRKKLV
uniref:Uncharacterized protein n=1 Tax=Chenopodium quinoa TaxID=63459 RepID=A0A803MK81_CHEQI